MEGGVDGGGGLRSPEVLKVVGPAAAATGRFFASETVKAGMGVGKEVGKTLIKGVAFGTAAYVAYQAAREMPDHPVTAVIKMAAAGWIAKKAWNW